MTTGNEMQARTWILQAAKRLISEGLIERTWGNISARVSDTHFLITPSGLAYETLREDQLVLVRIEDGTYEGNIKPSSEKGIHADAYRLRPDVRFVIHTHQYWASIAGIAGIALTGFMHPLLGKRIPCAAYGLPGTKRLRGAVAEEIASWPDCRAFLMKNHGAVCLGNDMEEAFAVSQALETVCKARVQEESAAAGAILSPCKLGASRREGEYFFMSRCGERERYPLKGADLPPAAALHRALYQAGDFRYISHETSPEVLAVSTDCDRLRPYLDDLAQIAGANIRCAEPTPRQVWAAMRGRNAVLIRNQGALCAGKTKSDLEAVRSLLQKGCAASLYADALPNCRPLGGLDAKIQRLVYQKSYAKKKEQS